MPKSSPPFPPAGHDFHRLELPNRPPRFSVVCHSHRRSRPSHPPQHSQPRHGRSLTKSFTNITDTSRQKLRREDFESKRFSLAAKRSAPATSVTRIGIVSPIIKSSRPYFILLLTRPHQQNRNITPGFHSFVSPVIFMAISAHQHHNIFHKPRAAHVFRYLDTQPDVIDCCRPKCPARKEHHLRKRTWPIRSPDVCSRTSISKFNKVNMKPSSVSGAGKHAPISPALLRPQPRQSSNRWARCATSNQQLREKISIVAQKVPL